MIDILRNELRTRHAAISSSVDLETLYHSLTERLDPLVHRPLYVPESKALLSRDGGVCSRDGSRLTFDPYEPFQHRCGVCGDVYAGDRHHRAWVWRYQLWLSERLVHGALLCALGDAGKYEWVTSALNEYCLRYRDYPNVDNVLGPTRLFFSTYLEAIWLIQICLAAVVLDASESPLPVGLRQRLEDVVAESAAIVGSFGEFTSNRQVWNSTALLAAGIFLSDTRLVKQGLLGHWRIVSLLTDCVTPDGWWHEGENYHFFALRGFLLAAELARLTGEDMYAQFPQLSRMFVAPLKTIFPDLTIPARGDSPFGVSIRQYRFAELWEVGWARTRDEQVHRVLSCLYSDSDDTAAVPQNEIAELEQNRSPSSLNREQLSWKALLWMAGSLEDGSADALSFGSGFVREDGPIVLRREPAVYVALECEGTGTGHGHPDSLNLTIWNGGPVQVDFGTGSYVAASLDWYRSWLCHSGPVRFGWSGREGAIVSAGWEATDALSWCQATIEDFAGQGSSVVRTVVVTDDCVIDIVDIVCEPTTVIDLPLHPMGMDSESLSGELVPSVGGHEQKKGVRTLTSCRRLDPIPIANHHELVLATRPDETITVMTAPGPSGLTFEEVETHTFPVRSCAGSGRWVQAFSFKRGSIHEIRATEAEVRLETSTGVSTFNLVSDGLEVTTGDQTVRVTGVHQQMRRVRTTGVVERIRFRCPYLDEIPAIGESDDILDLHGIVMGVEHYRRSEDSYPGAENFSARCCVVGGRDRIHFVVDITKSDFWPRPLSWPDPQLDNEIPDIHSDSVQLYMCPVDGATIERERFDSWCGVLVHPYQPRDHIPRVRVVVGRPPRVQADMIRTEQGYRVSCTWDFPGVHKGSEFLFDVVINEMYASRTRRAGQLALSGGGWVYLRGDRERPVTAVVGEFV